MIGMNQAVDYRGTTVYFQKTGGRFNPTERSVRASGAVGFP